MESQAAAIAPALIKKRAYVRFPAGVGAKDRVTPKKRRPAGLRGEISGNALYAVDSRSGHQ